MEYYNLPKEFQTIHSVCYEIVQQIEEFIICDDYKFLQTSEFTLTKEESEKYNESGDIWDFLKNNNEEGGYKHLNKRIMLGLLGDFCYFIQESLRCSNKMRLVVAYALLRRPMVEDLKILLKILFEDTFYDDFVNENRCELETLKGEALKCLLKKTDDIRFAKPFLTQGDLIISGDDVFHWIYDTANTDSIKNVSDRAMHPVTTRLKNKVDKMNFNFMFATSSDIDAFLKHYYTILPKTLIFFWDLFNTLVFGLFPDEINRDLFKKRVEKLIEITNPIHNTIKT